MVKNKKLPPLTTGARACALRGTTLIQLPKESPFDADNGAAGGDYPSLGEDSHPQLQGEFSHFLYRLAATAGSLGTERETYYSSSMLLK